MTNRTTISPTLDAELEQLAEGIERERERQRLESVRPFVEARQKQLAIQETRYQGTDAITIKGIEEIVQRQADFADDILAVEQHAIDALAERCRKEETKDSLREAIYTVERETTPRILQMSKTLASIVGDNNFDVSWTKTYPNDSINVLEIRIRADGDEYKVSLIKKRIIPYDIGLDSDDRKTIDLNLEINPKKETISIKYEKADYSFVYEFYGWGKGEYVREVRNRLSRFSKTPQKAFRIVADRCAAEVQSSYLQTFLEMYAGLPQMILDTAKQFMEDEAKRRQTLEDNARSVIQFAEGTK